MIEFLIFGYLFYRLMQWIVGGVMDCFYPPGSDELARRRQIAAQQPRQQQGDTANMDDDGE